MSADLGILITFTVALAFFATIINISFDRKKARNEIIPMTGKLAMILNALLPTFLFLGFFAVGFVTLRMRYEYFDGPVHYETLISDILMIAVLVLLLVWNVMKGYHTSFQLEILLVISSYTSGWGIADNYLWSDLTVAMCGFWIVAAVAGALLFMLGRLIKYRMKKRRYLRNSSPEGGYVHTVPSEEE
ncbi:MAG: hypothetical protein ACMUHM_05515 [Thermoplasmatota archaeon]